MWRIWGNFFFQKSFRRKFQALFFCRQVTNFSKNKNTLVEAACAVWTVACVRTKVAYTLKVPQTRPAVSHHCEGQWIRSCSTHFGRFLTRESYPVQSKAKQSKAKRKASSACRHASSTRAKCVNKESTIRVQCAPYRTFLSPVKFLHPHEVLCNYSKKHVRAFFHL
jgi:hypothetical protein